MVSSAKNLLRTARPRGLRPALLLLACLAPPLAGAQDTIELETTTIKGNKELPKILYIVPWKDPSGMPKIDLDPEFTEAQIFRRLYPPAYKRELDYYELLEASEKE